MIKQSIDEVRDAVVFAESDFLKNWLDCVSIAESPTKGCANSEKILVFCKNESDAEKVFLEMKEEAIDKFNRRLLHRLVFDFKRDDADQDYISGFYKQYSRLPGPDDRVIITATKWDHDFVFTGEIEKTKDNTWGNESYMDDTGVRLFEWKCVRNIVSIELAP